MPLRTPFSANRIKKFFKLDDVWLEADGAERLTPPEGAEALEARGPYEWEDNVEEETPGRSNHPSPLDKRTTRSMIKDKEKRSKQKLVVEIPRGKPAGF